MAAGKKLNARTVDALRGPRVVNDAQVQGLEFRITAAQAKSWSVRYRVPSGVNPKTRKTKWLQRRLTLGAYPQLSLADARERAKAALRSVDDGHDPQQRKQAARAATTLEAFAADYLTDYASVIVPATGKPRKKSWKDDRRQLKTYVLPEWRDRRMADITIDDVEQLLTSVAKRGPIMANRVRALLHKVFKYAVQKREVVTNPVTATVRPGTEKPRQRVLTDDEIRLFWTACDGLPLALAAAFKLRLLTAQRGGEVANLRWSDLDFANAVWTIPETDAKNGLAHRVPLSAPAVELLTKLRADAREDATFVLEGARGKRQRAKAAKTFSIPNFVGHDLRRTAASQMTGAGIPRLVVSKVLNHMEAGVTAVYDRWAYDSEKRIALDTWARKLDAILTAQPAASVVQFRRTR